MFLVPRSVLQRRHAVENSVYYRRPGGHANISVSTECYNVVFVWMIVDYSNSEWTMLISSI